MRTERVIVIGEDDNQIIERRFRAAGCDVVSAATREDALALARRQAHDKAVVLSQGSLINVAETVFNLRDLCPGIKVIVVLQRGTRQSNRFLRQLIDHPIEGSEIMTRRELQRHLQSA